MKNFFKICLLLLAVLSICACSTTKYVPVETVKHDTTYISKVKVDSVYHRDSVYVEHKGDTVLMYKYKYLSKYIEKHDTLWKERVDTVQVLVQTSNNEAHSSRNKSGAAIIFISLVLALCGLSLYLEKRKNV